MSDEYVKHLGYGDDERPVYVIPAIEDEDDEDYVPESCHVLAKWSNDAFTVHFDVANSVGAFFWAFDEAGDPSNVREIWCQDAEYPEHIDSESPSSIVWPPK